MVVLQYTDKTCPGHDDTVIYFLLFSWELSLLNAYFGTTWRQAKLDLDSPSQQLSRVVGNTTQSSHEVPQLCLVTTTQRPISKLSRQV